MAERLVTRDEKEKEYLISLKENWFQFIEFDVKKRIDAIEIANKIEGHDPHIGRDIYFKTLMQPMKYEMKKFFSDLVETRGKKKIKEA